jgi:hypothetical protein
MRCCCGPPCPCNSGGGKYKTTKIITFTGISVPTGVCLTGLGGLKADFSIINPNQTFTSQFSTKEPTGDGCDWGLTTSSGSDSTEITPCPGGSSFTGLILGVVSGGTVGSLLWNILLQTTGGLIIFTTAGTLFDPTDRSFSLDCNGTVTGIGNNAGASPVGLFNGTATVQDA